MREHGTIAKARGIEALWMNDQCGAEFFEQRPHKAHVIDRCGRIAAIIPGMVNAASITASATFGHSA